jgi:hypothetical protein
LFLGSLLEGSPFCQDSIHGVGQASQHQGSDQKAGSRQGGPAQPDERESLVEIDAGGHGECIRLLVLDQPGRRGMLPRCAEFQSSRKTFF